MDLLRRIAQRSPDPYAPLLLGRDLSLSLRDVLSASSVSLSKVRPGEVTALVGGFDAESVATFLRLLDLGAIVMPLTPDTAPQHEEFLQTGQASAVIADGVLKRLPGPEQEHPLLASLRERGEGGLVLFTSGTTGRPKAILHGARRFLARYDTPRPAMRTIALLRFDHIGGLNTLLHTLFNGGVSITPSSLAPDAVMRDVVAFSAELLPATPTFLRLLLMGGLLETPPPSLKLVTYGTERMDAGTLERLCAALPEVDFRQTYGMSELGILRIHSRARDSLWMQVGGEGVETRVVHGMLDIKAENRMIGYLNAPQPFDAEGWLATGDLVETDGPWVRIVGRQGDVVNVGGLKVMPEEVERAALALDGVLLAKAWGRPNPVTGQHVELVCRMAVEPATPEERKECLRALRRALAERLPNHAVPQRILLDGVAVNHRMKLT
ncbi:MAG: long-chain fatty acid--CoA ligase [Desulfovibrio sp.]|jgi:acyl-CoA synthetase (AMP-forming)/AMP-acid ligase II|nr:long-chain fatty acid--CoA ligase [Desulfovibrio sp.]